MGNAQTKLYWKLDNVLPSWHGMTGWWDSEQRPFVDDKDREQFIYSVIAVITHNGALDLRDHDFRLLYSRRSQDSDRIIARIVAEKNGVIVAKIEPQADGKDHVEAFMALKKDVEIQLDRIMEHVSVASSIAGPSGQSASQSSPAASSTVPQDAPPAYSDANVKAPKKG